MSGYGRYEDRGGYDRGYDDRRGGGYDDRNRVIIFLFIKKIIEYIFWFLEK